MKTPGRVGRIFFAVSIVAFGLQSLICSNFVPGLEPVPLSITARVLAADLIGLILMILGTLIAVDRKAHTASITLAILLLLWILLLHVPKLAVTPSNGGAWTAAFETIALLGAALILAGTAARRSDRQKEVFTERPFITVGRLCYGFSLPIFGLLHFVYPGYVASVIPAWIPAHLFWAYFIGVAFGLAGVSIVSGFQARITAILVGSMFGLWVLILHGPRAVIFPQRPAEWTSLFVALAMAGGAYLIAGCSGGGRASKSYTYLGVKE